MRDMKFGLATILVLGGLFGATRPLSASCRIPEGVQRLEGAFGFFHPSLQLTQSAWSGAQTGLLSWIQVELSVEGVVIVNRTPGYGIPVDIFRIEIEAINRDGEVAQVWNLEFSGNSETCQSLTLFPGQESRLLPLPKEITESSENEKLRFKFRLWGPYWGQ